MICSSHFLCIVLADICLAKMSLMILPCIIACSLIKNNYSWWPPSKVFMNEGQSCENQETVLKKNVILLMYVSKHYSIGHYYNSWKSTIFLSQQQYYLVGTVPFFTSSEHWTDFTSLNGFNQWSPFPVLNLTMHV